MPKIRIQADDGQVVYEGDGEATFMDVNLAEYLRGPILITLDNARQIFAADPPAPGELGGPEPGNQNQRLHVRRD